MLVAASVLVVISLQKARVPPRPAEMLDSPGGDGVGKGLPAGLSVRASGLCPTPVLRVLRKQECIETEAYRSGNQQPRGRGWQGGRRQAARRSQASDRREPDDDSSGQECQSC